MQTLEQTVGESFLKQTKNYVGRVRNSVTGKVAIYSLAGILGVGLGYRCEKPEDSGSGQPNDSSNNGGSNPWGNNGNNSDTIIIPVEEGGYCDTCSVDSDCKEGWFCGESHDGPGGPLIASWCAPSIYCTSDSECGEYQCGVYQDTEKCVPKLFGSCYNDNTVGLKSNCGYWQIPTFIECKGNTHCQDGACVKNCTPNCTDKECGDDDCQNVWTGESGYGIQKLTGPCGGCDSDKLCVKGQCKTANLELEFIIENESDEYELIKDNSTGLIWTASIWGYGGGFGDGLNWAAANEYCKNLEYGGYSDWKLPTIDELQTLLTYPDKQECEAGCVAYISKLFAVQPWNWKGYGRLWSSSPYSYIVQNDEYSSVWEIVFDEGKVQGNSGPGGLAGVLCVR